MPVQIETITKGMRITHPSGVVAITSLEEMKALRRSIKRMRDLHQKDLNQLDERIKAVEQLRTAGNP